VLQQVAQHGQSQASYGHEQNTTPLKKIGSHHHYDDVEHRNRDL
jgi:hypothetical protein